MDPTKRFSDRVENYIQFRPRYPQKVVAALREDCALTPDSTVADIGSGTGFLSELFLQNGNEVFAVEPNREMREAGRRLLGKYPGFQSVDGRAEATALPERSVDLVAAGQSFHWFDLEKARKEFVRILKAPGWMMIVWNERDSQSTAFMKEYEQVLNRHVTDRSRTAHKKVYETALDDFFGTNGFTSRTFGILQQLDYEGLKGRLLSSSYSPAPGRPNHEPMLAALFKIFQAHQVDGRVTLHYTTRMYYGRLSI